VREQLCKLECRKRELSAELEASKAAEIAIHPNLPDLYRRKVAELQQVLPMRRPAQRLLLSLDLSSTTSKFILVGGADRRTVYLP
jgi:hypothetical protein